MSDFAAQALWTLCANALVATVLALGAWFAQRADRPRLVHALCLLALLKLVTPPMWSIPVAILPAATAPDPTLLALLVESGAESIVPLGEASSAAPLASSLDAATVGLTLALLGTGALVALAWARTRRFRRLIRVADAAPPTLRARATAMATRVGLRRCPELLLLPARISPMLCLLGGRTLLLLPRDLVASLGEAELDALLTHELAHAQRRDHWVRVLELVAFSLYWWLPTAWWLRRALHVAEERCCDARVLALHPSRPRAYADALLHTLDFLAGSTRAMPPVACGASTYTDLKQRLTTIMTRSEDRPLSRLTRTGLLALAVGVLPIAPSFAQETERADEGKMRAELRSAAREVARLRAEIDAIRAELGVTAKTSKVADAEVLDRTEAHHARLRDEVAKTVREATRNIKVDTEALIEKARLHEGLHNAIARRPLLDDSEQRTRLEALRLNEHQMDPELLAKVLREHQAHDFARHGAEIAQHAARAAEEAIKHAQAAHAKAMEAHAKAMQDHAVDAKRKATGSRDADAAEERREAVVDRLRRVERSGAEKAVEAAEAQRADVNDAERKATRARRVEDRRAAEMKAIEAEMQKLQRKLEALRKQGTGEESADTGGAR